MRWGARHVALGSVLVAIAIACGKNLADDPPEDAGADASSDARVGVDDAGNPCLCLPEVPKDWIGPLVVDELADCAAPWSIEEGRGFADLDAGVHSCACSCDPKPVECLMHFDVISSPQCASGACAAYFPLVEGACQGKGGACNTLAIHRVDGGGCQPGEVKRIDPAVFARTGRRCVTAAPLSSGSCEPNERCAPKPPATGAHCIYRAGSFPCPPAYDRAATYNDGKTDTRGCTACGCGQDAAACDVALHTQTDCMDQPTKLNNDNCVSLNSFTSVKLHRKAAVCVATGGVKTGEVKTDGVVTVCCAKP